MVALATQVVTGYLRPVEILANPPAPALAADGPFNIDYSGFVTEDDTPADSEFSEKQMRLLTRALHASWKPGVPFTVTANVGLYFHLNSSPLVPDVMLALGVGSPEDPMPREHRACFVWNRGQIPDIVIAIVLNREGDELTRKFERYASHNVPYYVVYDPGTFIQAKALRCFELDLHRFPKTLPAYFTS